MDKNQSPINQWMELNRILSNSRVINLGLIIVAFMMAVAILLTMTRPPIVIGQKDADHIYYAGSYEDTVITNDDAAKFIKEFIQVRYVWKKHQPYEILQNIKPLVTEEFFKMAEGDINKESHDMEKLKSVEQNVTNIEVSIDKGKALAKFDRVIRINGLPLVTPTEISFNIIKRTRSKWNPVGLYVHGIIEHSDK